MKKQDIMQVLIEHPEAVFSRRDNKYHKFTITAFGENGRVFVKTVSTTTEDNVDEWTVRIQDYAFPISTRDVLAVVADTPEEFLEVEKETERKNVAKQEQMRLDAKRRREIGVRLMKALQGLGVSHRFYADREDCDDWGTIGWWALMNAQFDLDLTDEIERLISIIEHAKVEA